MVHETDKDMGKFHPKHVWLDLASWRMSLLLLLLLWLSSRIRMPIQGIQVWSLGWEGPLQKEMPTTSVFLPRKSHGLRRLAGYSLQVHKRIWHNLAAKQEMYDWIFWAEGHCCCFQSLSRVQLIATPWIAAHQAFLPFTISQSFLKFMSIESVMLSYHLILCLPLPLPLVFLRKDIVCMQFYLPISSPIL